MRVLEAVSDGELILDATHDVTPYSSEEIPQLSFLRNMLLGML